MINWSIAAPLFGVNFVLLSALVERSLRPIKGLLSGEGIAYRHADTADFDTELNMERRIREAGG